MVALLWDESNREAAIALENLRNDLSEREPYTLLCAYPLSSMEWGPNNGPFREICSTHSSVRLRFCAPQAQRVIAETAKRPEDEFSQVKSFEFELSVSAGRKLTPFRRLKIDPPREFLDLNQALSEPPGTRPRSRSFSR